MGGSKLRPGYGGVGTPRAMTRNLSWTGIKKGEEDDRCSEISRYRRGDIRKDLKRGKKGHEHQNMLFGGATHVVVVTWPRTKFRPVHTHPPGASRDFRADCSA